MGGHSVVVVQFHDDLAIDPSSHHDVTTNFVDHSLIPTRGSLESVAQVGRTFDRDIDLGHESTSSSSSEWCSIVLSCLHELVIRLLIRKRRILLAV